MFNQYFMFMISKNSEVSKNDLYAQYKKEKENFDFKFGLDLLSKA